MQLITFLSAAAATVATVSAKTAQQLNSECNVKAPKARIINRCDYPVYIWSVWKGIGCPKDGMVTLKKGEIYQENYQKPEGGDQGVSIKISKTQDCKSNDITQLEYFIEERPGKEQWWDNYLDVSYVDCLGGDCPTKKEGYYLKSGSQTGVAKASAGNTRCPVLSCSDAAECAKMSYILPDDVQTKTCPRDEDMDFYMCGGQAPSDSDYNTAPKPASSSKVDTPAAKPTTTLSKVVSSAAYKANVAAVTNAPEVKEPIVTPKIKTKVVYVTAYENAKAKRHDHRHAHARRHQPHNA